MKRVLIFVALFITALALFALPAARAEIWSEVTGDAKEHITYICAPCCKLTNYHPTRTVRARLFTMMDPRVLILKPQDTETFMTPKGCMTAGFGLEVMFIN